MASMLNEYPSCHFSTVRWASADNPSSLSASASSERYLIAASSDTEPEAQLRIYTFQDTPDDVRIVLQHTHALKSAANQLVTFGRDQVFCICKDSSAHLLSASEDSSQSESSWQLNEQHHWDQLDRYRLTDVSYCKPSNCVVASGAEGKLHFFDLSNATHQTSQKLSHSSINCVETLNRNEIALGNETGDLKLFDIRTGKVEFSSAWKLSSLKCIRRHHSNGHIVSYGNDLGLLSVLDLRNQSKNLEFFSGHGHSITHLDYVSTETNSVLTSSLDGQLLKWNLKPDNRMDSIQCVFGYKDEAPIVTFDLSLGGRLAVFTDLEVLHVMSL